MEALAAVFRAPSGVLSDQANAVTGAEEARSLAETPEGSSVRIHDPSGNEIDSVPSLAPCNELAL
jgi:hypothetical protein